MQAIGCLSRSASMCLLSCLFLLSACGQPDDSEPPSFATVMATVAGDSIRVGDLARLIEKLPEHLRSGLTGKEATRDHLQILIDRSLVLAAAKEAALDQDSDVLAELEGHVATHLLEIVTDRLVTQRISYTEQELLEAYEENHAGWQLWPAHILCATEAAAWEIHRLLEGGADFAALAREKSLADDASRGGELREWFDFSEAVPPLRDATFGLEIGEWSVPIHTIHGWEVVLVLDKRRLTFAQMRTTVAQQLQRMRWAQRRHDLADSLGVAYGVRIHRNHTSQLLAALLDDQPLSDQLMASPIAEWEGGRITYRDYITKIKQEEKAPVPVDSIAVGKTLNRYFLIDALLVQLGGELGMADEPLFVSWRQRRLEQVMIEHYRSQLIRGKISVSVQEVRDHYDKYRGPYSLPGEINLTEALVDTEPEATRILEAVRNGADFEELAVKYTKRNMPPEPDLHLEASDRARLVIDPLRSSPYHQVFQDSSLRVIGKVQGPIVMENRYALFRLDKPIEPYHLPFERVARQIRARLRGEKADALFNEHMRKLRSEHAAQIVVDEDVVRRFADTYGRTPGGTSPN